MEKVNLTISGHYNGFHTVTEFYDCECDQDYIKHKATEPTCNVCGSCHDEAPDSRLNEVTHLAALKNKDEFLMYMGFPAVDIFTGKEVHFSAKTLRDLDLEYLYDTDEAPAEIKKKMHSNVMLSHAAGNGIYKAKIHKNPITLFSVDLHDLEALQNGEEIS